MFPPWNTWKSNHSSHTIGRSWKVNLFFMSLCAAIVRSIITWRANDFRRRQRLKSHSQALKVGDEDVCGPGSRKVIILRLPKFFTLSRERKFYPPPFIQAQTSRAGPTWRKQNFEKLLKPPQRISEWVIARQGKVMTTANEIACSAVPIHSLARHHRQTDGWVSYLISPVIFLFLLPLRANENTRVDVPTRCQRATCFLSFNTSTPT